MSTDQPLARLLVPVLLVGAVLVMIVPVPPALMDGLLALNIAIAVMVMLGVVLLQDSLDLSVFPSILLLATLVRLSLNVSSTRLILLEGYAGKVIDTFGNFVVGGSVVVGLVVFLILVVIQFVVITNGAGRVAEVAARFTLDAMPGKQMAIDADLAAGLIDEEEARTRRKRITEEAEFYGAMDGASKFVKGDAIAGIVIVLINLIGGFAIGVGSRGLPLGEAVNTYSLLTIGDGLVSQIPALLLSVSTGLLVTRVGSDGDMGPKVVRQLLSNPRALRLGAAVILGIGMLPGLPKVVFLLLAGGLFLASQRSQEAEAAAIATSTAKDGDEATVEVSPDDPEAIIEQMRLEPLELHLAYDILDLIDPAHGGDLLDRVRSLRHQIAMDLGIVMPFVRTRDDVSLRPSTYRIMLHGVEVASGEAPRDRVLALPVGDGNELRALDGTETIEPVFRLPAFWVPASARASASATGATVVDRSSVIVTHLAEVVRDHASSLLSRQQVQMLIEGMRYDEPLLANEVSSEALPIGTLHRVLGSLLDDRVPIRDLPRIVESVSGAGPQHPIEHLVNAARTALGSIIVSRVAPENRLGVVTLEPGLEAQYHERLREVEGVTHLVLDPQQLDRLHREVERVVGLANRHRDPVALVCAVPLRRPLQRTLDSAGLALPVLAYPELPGHVELSPIGVIGLAHIDA